MKIEQLMPDNYKKFIRPMIRKMEAGYAHVRNPKSSGPKTVDIHQQYEVDSLLRRGGLFNILLGSQKNGSGRKRNVVIKIGYRRLVNLSNFEGWNEQYPMEYFISEATILDYLGDTGYTQAPRLYDWGIGAGLPVTGNGNVEFEVEDRPIFIYEYVEGIDLDDYYHDNRDNKDTLPRQVVLSFAFQVLSALEGLHERGVLHRDIRMPNILLDSQGDIKLIDFNMSRFLPWDKHRTPDIILARDSKYFEIPDKPQLDYTTDIYEVGLWLHTIYTGIYPYSELQQAVATKGKASRSIFGYRKDDCNRLGEIENRLLTMGFTIPLEMKKWHSKRSMRANKDDPLELLLLDMLSPDARQRPSARECIAKLKEIGVLNNK